MKKIFATGILTALISQSAFSIDCQNFSGLYKGKCGDQVDKMIIIQNGCSEIKVYHRIDSGKPVNAARFYFGKSVSTPNTWKDESADAFTELAISYEASISNGQLFTARRAHKEISTFDLNHRLTADEIESYSYSFSGENLLAEKREAVKQIDLPSGTMNIDTNRVLNCEYTKKREIRFFDQVALYF